MITPRLRNKATVPLRSGRAGVRASGLLYVDHVENCGKDLFRLACEHDLEGIVAKHKFSPYLTGGTETSWVKSKNRVYSQMFVRNELFKRNGEKRATGTTDGRPHVSWRALKRS